jgi:predicted RNase H-like nuclease (RuvC/YqgF family)
MTATTNLFPNDHTSRDAALASQNAAQIAEQKKRAAEAEELRIKGLQQKANDLDQKVKELAAANQQITALQGKATEVESKLTTSQREVQQFKDLVLHAENNLDPSWDGVPVAIYNIKGKFAFDAGGGGVDIQSMC